MYRVQEAPSFKGLFGFGSGTLSIKKADHPDSDWYYLSSPGFVDLGACYDHKISIPANTWTHIAITADGQQGQVFVNNQVPAGNAAPLTGSGLSASASLYLGAPAPWEWAVACYIDELVICNDACGAAWVDDIYNTTLAGTNLFIIDHCDDVIRNGMELKRIQMRTALLMQVT